MPTTSPSPMTRRLSLSLPILFYLLALAALWLYLRTDDGPMLVVSLLSGAAGLASGAALVMHQRAAVGRLSSDS